jgi:hypothetical protein
MTRVNQVILLVVLLMFLVGSSDVAYAQAGYYIMDNGVARVTSPQTAYSIRPEYWEIWCFKDGSQPSDRRGAPGHWGTIFGKTLQEVMLNLENARKAFHDLEGWTGHHSAYGYDNSFGPIAFMPDSPETQADRSRLSKTTTQFDAWIRLPGLIDDAKRWKGIADILTMKKGSVAKAIQDELFEVTQDFLDNLQRMWADIAQIRRDLFGYNVAADRLARLLAEAQQANDRLSSDWSRASDIIYGPPTAPRRPPNQPSIPPMDNRPAVASRSPPVQPSVPSRLPDFGIPTPPPHVERDLPTASCGNSQPGEYAFERRYGDDQTECIVLSRRGIVDVRTEGERVWYTANMPLDKTILMRADDMSYSFFARCINQDEGCVEEIGQDVLQVEAHQPLNFSTQRDFDGFVRAAKRIGVNFQ